MIWRSKKKTRTSRTTQTKGKNFYHQGHEGKKPVIPALDAGICLACRYKKTVAVKAVQILASRYARAGMTDKALFQSSLFFVREVSG
jgi:hypothetical protein